jgi:hypothetical protein
MIKHTKQIGDLFLDTEMKVPSLGELLVDAPCQLWLLQAFDETGETVWSKATFMGRLGRLWSPENSSALYAHKIREGWESPPDRIWLWAKGLSGSLCYVLEQQALTELERLPLLFALLQQARTESSSRASSIAIEILCFRDDLESIAAVLRASGDSNQLDAGLRASDLAAQCHLSIFASLEISFHERLSSVSWQEPDAWWGALYSA